MYTDRTKNALKMQADYYDTSSNKLYNNDTSKDLSNFIDFKQNYS